MAFVAESFENLEPGQNIVTWPHGSAFLQPGTNGVFQFPSGLRLLAPIPNNNPNTAAIIGDFQIATTATWGVSNQPSPGDVLSSSDVPNGVAYIGRNVEVNGELAFGFSSEVFQVYAQVNAGSRIGLAAYDASGKLVSAARVKPVAAENWDENLFFLFSKKPIAKVVFTGQFVIVDSVGFDTTMPRIFNGTKGNDKIDVFYADLIFGKKGDDKILAREGDDTLDGGNGKDRLFGGDGTDTLIGGKKKDKLWGGEGQDSYLFNSLDAADVVKDFNPADDNILLDRKAFTMLGPGQISQSQFGTSASSADVRIFYDADTGRLFYDVDGNGPTQAVQFAKLAPNLALTAEHFFVV